MYLSCGHAWRSRILTKTMRSFDTLAEAWAWANTQKKRGKTLYAKIWLVSATEQPVLLRPWDIQEELGLPHSIDDWA
jgi:hypothetical protein